jgi:hypothetical protein
MFIPILVLIPIIIVAVVTAVYVTRLRSEIRTLYRKYSLKIHRSGANDERYSVQVHWLNPANPNLCYNHPLIWSRALETTGAQTDSFTREQMQKISDFLEPFSMELIVIEKPVRLTD